jgi:hypothetical protein
MVSFRATGRMGNFLFEAASSYGYARRHDLEWSVPNWTTHHFWSPLYLQHLVHPNYVNYEEVLINEHVHHYHEIPFDEEWRGRNIVLNGFYQSEKFFAEYRDEILEKFGYPYQLNKGFVSVHVRRTDYLTLSQKHPPVTKEWYDYAMSHFEGYKFIFYSDDIEWCKQNFSDRNDCYFSHGSIEQDLYEASWCEHNICSASTFSWWQMWLNQNPDKRVFFPEKWFNDNWDNLDTSDILPDYVTKLKLT